ncbi:gamma-glutamyltransferase family protein [Phyllobacterium sp. YR531]|uniref:gamma-glutamyltransferase family protein n=1 Tax=Phyllobacterium sp. YR531 TaxID=1144343 RepID=UPI00026F6472|nr:gamma-glutamyltransferase family protein [Phyllobacterium sp. YR531]EJN00062.1 gamma-glutamyltransferase [Phyllobacterium sp. YR531]
MTRNFEKPGRSLAVATNGMAATSHPAATLVAVETLQRGGNAIDAAVAAAAVQGVVEAGSTGIGGDCFCMLSQQGSTDVIAYNGSGRTPTAARFETFSAMGIAKIPAQSPHAVTIPGAIEAWARLVRDHGRLDLGDILRPAVRIAREGYAIAPRVAYDLMNNTAHIAANERALTTFLDNGKPLPVGAIHSQPQLAHTLEAVGENGPDAFYTGAIAEDMVASLQSLGGLHTLADFAAAKGEYVTPISTNFHGRTVYECPPNGQGVIALMIMNILSRFKIKDGPLDIDNLYIELEATRLAYAARDQFLADNPDDSVPTGYLLSDALAGKLAARINMAKVIDPLPVLDEVEHKDTVYISVVDKDRNAVSLINSIFGAYGSGIVSRRSGVLFHNRGSSFSLTAGHPNAIAPNKRPMHTIIPGMIAEDGRVMMSFGVMGGHYQAMGHAHFMSKLFNHGMDIQSAMDLPRLFPLPGTTTVECEEAILSSVGPDLMRRGYTVIPAARPIGGAQAVQINWKQNSLIGASDFRKDGMALGY